MGALPTLRQLVQVVLPLLAQQAVAMALPRRAEGDARTFELTLTWEKHAPDGFEREMVLVNGQYPGPLLEINQGEDVEVLVHNNMPFNTTVHYHGIEMAGTPWSDGTPGLTQRQIQTNGSFTYKWTATQYGSYWYHAHQRGQIDDGLYGPIVIHPAANQTRPFSLISSDEAELRAMMDAEQNVRPLLLSDFRHVVSEDGWAIEEASGIETPCYDAVLFNGKGRVQCWSQSKINALLTPTQKLLLQLGNATNMTAKSCVPPDVLASVLAAGLPTNVSALPASIFEVCTPTTGDTEVVVAALPSESESDDGRTHTWLALDIIGTFGLMAGSFAIDGHPLYVYAVDGSYIEPQRADALTVNNGDRYSVLVNITTAGNYTMRMASTATAQMLAGYGTLSVEGGGGTTTTTTTTTPTAYIDDVGLNTTADVVFFDANTMKSFPADQISRTADATYKLAMRVAGYSYNWALNETIYPPQLDNEHPLLFDDPVAAHNNVTIATLHNQWIDLVLEAASVPMPTHPIHKHGTKMWLIGQGDGTFNYTTVDEALAAAPDSFNVVDPPKRDTWSTPPASTGPTWQVLRYQASNPGAWFLHCHVTSHLMGGMAMVIQDGVDQWPVVPDEYRDYH